MKDIENELKRLPLRKPSERLDANVLGSKPEPLVETALRKWRIPMYTAAVLSLIVGMIGFVLGAALSSRSQTDEIPEPLPVTFYVSRDYNSTQNPFDYTRPSKSFFEREFQTKTN